MKWKEAIKKKLPDGKDRRVKLSEKDKQNIIALHKANTPIREIARIYEGQCSRRLIQYVIFPERRAKVAAQFIARRADGRYKPSKEEWAKTMREHRQYKARLFAVKKRKTL